MLNFHYHKNLDSFVTPVTPKRVKKKLVTKILYWKDLGNKKTIADVKIIENLNILEIQPVIC